MQLMNSWVLAMNKDHGITRFPLLTITIVTVTNSGQKEQVLLTITIVTVTNSGQKEEQVLLTITIVTVTNSGQK